MSAPADDAAAVSALAGAEGDARAAAAPAANGAEAPATDADAEEAEVVLEMETDPTALDRVLTSPALAPTRRTSDGDLDALELGAAGDGSAAARSRTGSAASSGGDRKLAEGGSDGGSPTKSGEPVFRSAPEVADDTVEQQGKVMCCGLRHGVHAHDIMPYEWEVYKNDLGQIKTEVLAGVTVAFAQVSESMAFSFIAGVGPMLGLHAAWIIGLSLSFFGSRTAMINGATGVRAAVVAPFIVEHGIGMLFWIVLAISFFQALAAALRLAKFVRMVPRPAMVGFVNGLAIILGYSQVNQFQYPNSDTFLPGDKIGWMIFVALMTVMFSVVMPRIPKIGGVLPPSLFGIVGAVFAEFVIVRAAAGNETPTIDDISKVEAGLPTPFFLDPQYEGQIPDLSWKTVGTAAVPAFIAAMAGMVEAVMTMEVVNDLTDSENPRPNQQLFALSIGNFISGIFGTMGGGATIGLSMINCHNGSNGKYRISGVVAGIMVLLLILVATPVIKIIPTASLVGIMAIVVFHTFEWTSVPTVIVSCMPESMRHKLDTFIPINMKRKIRRVDAVVIVLVTVVTLVVDLFTAVLAGVCLTACAFAWQARAQVEVASVIVPHGGGEKKDQPVMVHRVVGPVCFSSAMELQSLLKPRLSDPDDTEIHLTKSQVSDYSGLHLLNTLGARYRGMGKRLKVKALGHDSARLLAKASSLVGFHYETTQQPTEEEFDLTDPDELHVVAQARSEHVDH